MIIRNPQNNIGNYEGPYTIELRVHEVAAAQNFGFSWRGLDPLLGLGDEG